MDHVEVTDLEEWRAWLEQHHDRSPGTWLITFRKGRGPYVGPYEANNEALRYGWFDQHQAPVDDLRVKHLYRPRRPYLPWSRPDRFESNKAIANGRMTATGLMRIQAAKADGSWCSADQARIGRLPLDLIVALDGRPDLRDKFDVLDPKSKNGILWRLARAGGGNPTLRPENIRALLQALGPLVVDRHWWEPPVQSPDEHIDLKISRGLLGALESNHTRGGTLVLSGPPGLSKSWSAVEFQRRHPHSVGFAKLPAGSCVSWLNTQRRILAAVRGLGSTRPEFSEGETRKAVGFLLGSALRAATVSGGGTFPMQAVRDRAVSIVIDDAQRLSGDAIDALLAREETLPRCPRFGLILIGDVSLGRRIRSLPNAGPSASVVTVSKDDLTTGDMQQFLSGIGIRDADAQAVIVCHLNQRGQWSLRRAKYLADRSVLLAVPVEPRADHARRALGSL